MFLSAYLYLRIQYTMFFSFSQYTFADFCTCLACLRFGFAIACELYFIEDSDHRPSAGFLLIRKPDFIIIFTLFVFEYRLNLHYSQTLVCLQIC